MDIKLIVTDLDGTLLNSSHQIPKDFFTVYEQIRAKNIVFAIASGRQYYTIANQFKTIFEDVYILAENGTYVKRGDKELLLNTMPLEEARYFVKKGFEIPSNFVILCGKKSAYIQKNHEAIFDKVQQFYERVVLVDDLLAVEDLILKVTFVDFGGIEQAIYPLLQPFKDSYKIALAGHAFIDITPKNSNKGQAVKFIQQLEGIKKEETLVFGDMLNDFEMMQEAGYSYAMKNGHEEIKKIALFETEYSNDENGVLHEIQKII